MGLDATSETRSNSILRHIQFTSEMVDTRGSNKLADDCWGVCIDTKFVAMMTTPVAESVCGLDLSFLLLFESFEDKIHRYVCLKECDSRSHLVDEKSSEKLRTDSYSRIVARTSMRYLNYMFRYLTTHKSSIVNIVLVFWSLSTLLRLIGRSLVLLAQLVT